VDRACIQFERATALRELPNDAVEVTSGAIKIPTSPRAPFTKESPVWSGAPWCGYDESFSVPNDLSGVHVTCAARIFDTLDFANMSAELLAEIADVIVDAAVR
jgi:hypothetical protein